MANKDRARTAFTRGKSNLEKGRPLQAMLSFTEAVKCDEEHYESYLSRAEAFLQLEYHYLARDDAQKCIDLKPSAIEGYLKKGEIECKAEAYKEARETYEKALDVDSQNAEILAALNKTNRAERAQMFREKRIHMQGIGAGSVLGVLILVINEFFIGEEAVQGILMKGIIFVACTYLGYAATKLYTDLLEQQRKLMLEPPKDVQTADDFEDKEKDISDQSDQENHESRVTSTSERRNIPGRCKTDPFANLPSAAATSNSASSQSTSTSNARKR